MPTRAQQQERQRKRNAANGRAYLRDYLYPMGTWCLGCLESATQQDFNTLKNPNRHPIERTQIECGIDDAGCYKCTVCEVKSCLCQMVPELLLGDALDMDRLLRWGDELINCSLDQDGNNPPLLPEQGDAYKHFITRDSRKKVVGAMTDLRRSFLQLVERHRDEFGLKRNSPASKDTKREWIYKRLLCAEPGDAGYALWANALGCFEG
ncbi:hypothetical protein NM208_g5349 [Fusarium decemcellulare]|uniref:Uncharacterized protein n=2 Tax=Fusarium decemcellulare TaxID=57161 RepID=A0ACC1SHG0_9HYPO|nr:hypothetical protein NM208_g8675 [Fusarium decemcellulare]KAJ3539791.1 hypothetical protein NM208_g5349 [Fusarium decemcellulare]